MQKSLIARNPSTLVFCELNVIVADATIASTTSAMTGTFDGIDFASSTLDQGSLWYGSSANYPNELSLGNSGQI